jgi:plastocyanin
VDNASPSINLADTTVLNVTITPQNWSGPVTLTTTGLPADITGAFDNASVTVNGSTPATAKLTLTSVSSTAPNATPFQIVGTAGTVTQNAASTINVKSYITINLPVNADSVTESFGTVTITAPADIQNNPVTINFVNLDSTPHEIHAEGNGGFEHGVGEFGQGQADSPVRQITQSGSYDWHLHDDAPPEGPPGGTVIIQ